MGIESVGSYASIGISALFALSAVLGVLLDLKRGLIKSVSRLIIIAVCAVAAFFISNKISPFILSKLEGKTVMEFIDAYMPFMRGKLPEKAAAILQGLNTEAVEYIIAMLLSLFIVPTVFICIFLLLRTVTVFIHPLVYGLLSIAKKKKKNIVSVFLSGVVGLVRGLFLAGVLLSPIVGITHVCEPLRDDLLSEKIPVETRGKIESVYGTVDSIAANPMIKAVGKCGGNYIYERFATHTVEGEEFNMIVEIDSVAKVVADAMSLKGMNFSDPTEANKAALIAVKNDIGKSDFITVVVSGGVVTAAKAVNEGTFQLPVQEPVKTLLLSLTKVLETSDKYTVVEDLDTLLNVYFLLTDSDVLSKMEGGDADSVVNAFVSVAVGEDSVINQCIDILDKNERYSGVVASLSKVSLSLMSGALDMEAGEMDQLYEDVQNDIKDVLTIKKDENQTVEEYEAVISEELSAQLDKNGITGIDQSIIDDMAAQIAKDNIDRGDVEPTQADINAAILKYYEAYSKQQSQGN